MRTRIALATAMAVSFMITSFDISTVAAQAATNPAATPSGTSGASASSTGAVSAHAQSPTDLSINDLLWPQVIDSSLPAGSSSTTSGSVDPSTTATTPAPAPAPTPAVAPAPPPPPPPPPTDTSSTDTADWQCIRVHESGDAYNDPTRPSGAYGILESTWESFGYSGWPYEAAAPVQDALALELYHEYGWNPWSTRTVCGLG